jgi:pimeloyl-ACP methyl ester carboxylesterase
MSSISFFEKGNGQAVILIHGFCETNELWNYFATSLSKDFRVICPNLPGCGDTLLAGDNSSMEKIALELEAWMEENHLDNPIIIGHSLGGYVTLALLELMARKLKAVGLFHSTAFADDDSKKGLRDRTVIFLNKHGVDTFVTSFVPPLFSEDQRDEFKDEIDLAIVQAKNCSLNGLVALTTAMRDRKDRFEILKAYSGHKLMIAGIQDGAIKIESSRLQKDAFTDYFELENTGHMGMIEQKEKTLEIVRKFCKKAIK